MTDFSIIPAIDLKGGSVVHASGGDRAAYRPIETPLGPSDDAIAIARALVAVSDAPALYIADLDAIEGVGNHFELCRDLASALPQTDLWIDAGFSNVTDCAFWLPLGATLVIGTESLAGIDDWVSIRGAFGESVLLSLDYDAEGRRGPAQLFDDPALWPGRLIVMSLARVGIGAGPDLARIEEIESKAGGCAVYAAGGVRDASDLAALMARGASGALVGTALHAGALTQKEIAALFRERRP